MRMVFFCLLLPFLAVSQSGKVRVNGMVTDESGNGVYGAAVVLGNTTYGVVTDENGKFGLALEEGSHRLEVSYIGYKPNSVTINVIRGEQNEVQITLEESAYALKEVVLSGKSVIQQVEEKAFNVSVVDAKKLHHTTLDMGHALDRVSGIRVRESGGVGSQMNFSINGFRGRQVRFFVDGIPMDNFGSSYQLNNIPVNLAQRIEVYKGVVPVGLGSDALGGAVNIITNTYDKSHLDASYSYGSFNTHRSMVNAVYVAESGFIAQINAFQNYSDNNYKMDVEVSDLNTGEYYPMRTVRRFHDKYHNEMLIANVGVVNKPYADRLLFGVTVGSSYREIQTGARVESVFGAWHRKGNIIMPSLKYKKDDFLVKGLDFRLNANINLGQEKNIDTLNRRYNWLGQFKEYDNPGGERSYSLYYFRNNNGLASANWDYTINNHSKITLNNTFNTFNRKGRNRLAADSERYEQPQKTMKNIVGLGYQYESENWNATLFGKQYFQQNKFSTRLDTAGSESEYVKQTGTFNYFGYGFAATYFLTDNLQLKASYEKSYRLPDNEELFGDLINLEGNISLKPEHSHNYNLGAAYWWQMRDRHRFNFSANGFYRDAHDFIYRRLNTNQAMQVMDNLGSVSNAGIEGEIRYQYDNKLMAGMNITYQNMLNKTRNDVYNDRIPNIPYLYGNADVTYNFSDVWGENNILSLGYNMLYVHDFYLFWPSLGGKNTKRVIPEQVSHDLNVTYTFRDKVQFTLECRNLLDKNLYDNFSLQKPGRSFYAKIKYTFL
ncbi:TonB-dependent receptor [Sinomicrobium pectinilyticum]|uniref:TonB-dependent receptor n=2 Tax=Sinomicrobium pectinilyticum TaxID=1084421 RepID=A0A3N0EKA4_SINP1|nr:TonB-dependent receptor [Sinomicrobium pectinilyticum]